MEEIVDTNFCKRFIARFHEFESGFLPVELRFDLEKFEHWISSEFFICSGIIEWVSSTEWIVKGYISFFVTTERCYERICLGLDEEYMLAPYALGETPCLYYSSAINLSGISTKRLLEAATRELESLGVKSNSAFCIVVSENGERHARKNGFHLTPFQYRNSYPMMELCGWNSDKYYNWSKLLSWYDSTDKPSFENCRGRKTGKVVSAPCKI